MSHRSFNNNQLSNDNKPSEGMCCRLFPALNRLNTYEERFDLRNSLNVVLAFACAFGDYPCNYHDVFPMRVSLPMYGEYRDTDDAANK